MALTDLINAESLDGTKYFRVDVDGNVTATGTISTTGTDDFGTSGIKADVIAESTAAAGVTIDGLLLKDGKVDLNGVAGAFILDADADTHIGASADDVVDITVNGAVDFRIAVDAFTALSGSLIATNTIAETTAASGVTVDGTLIKDGGATLIDSVTFIVDNSDPTKKLAFQVSGVTASTTRTMTVPDADMTMVSDPASYTVLAALTAGNGAAKVGVEDSGSKFTATTVEAALAEAATEYQAYRDQLVTATVACADAAGGATDALLSVQLKRAMDHSTNVASARQFLLLVNSAQYSDAHPTQASVTLGTVTAGSVVATVVAGSLFLIETSAAGLFGCTVTNTDDETLYFSAATAVGGASDVTKRCVVVGSNSDSAAWSA